MRGGKILLAAPQERADEDGDGRSVSISEQSIASVLVARNSRRVSRKRDHLAVRRRRGRFRPGTTDEEVAEEDDEGPAASEDGFRISPRLTRPGELISGPVRSSSENSSVQYRRSVTARIDLAESRSLRRKPRDTESSLAGQRSRSLLRPRLYH